jgi:hypothetical protein
MPSLNETITKLKEIHLYSPTLKLYGVHLRNCVTLDVEPASFVTFGQDILNASPIMRAEIFNPEPRPPYEAFQRYPAYSTPVTAEMFTGTTPPHRPRGKRKPKAKRRTK